MMALSHLSPISLCLSHLPPLDHVVPGAVVLLAAEGGAAGAAQQPGIAVDALVVPGAAVLDRHAAIGLLAEG